MCNCRSKKDCPLNEQCLEKTLVYKALVKTEQKIFTYFGTAEREFKTRYNNHVSSFHMKKQKQNGTFKKDVGLEKQRKTLRNFMGNR